MHVALECLSKGLRPEICRKCCGFQGLGPGAGKGALLLLRQRVSGV